MTSTKLVSDESRVFSPGLYVSFLFVSFASICLGPLLFSLRLIVGP